MTPNLLKSLLPYLKNRETQSGFFRAAEITSLFSLHYSDIKAVVGNREEKLRVSSAALHQFTGDRAFKRIKHFVRILSQYSIIPPSSVNVTDDTLILSLA